MLPIFSVATAAFTCLNFVEDAKSVSAFIGGRKDGLFLTIVLNHTENRKIYILTDSKNKKIIT